MKNIYVVTRIVSESTDSGVDVPNLGVHTSLKSANKHYNSILEDRKSRRGKVLWDRYNVPDFMRERVQRVREACIENNTNRENLFIEMWKLE